MYDDVLKTKNQAYTMLELKTYEISESLERIYVYYT